MSRASPSPPPAAQPSPAFPVRSPIPPVRDRAAVAELLVAAILTAGAVALHVRFFLRAGPLWRDEADTVAVATSPTLHQLFANLRFDSFPLACEMLVRGWAGLVGGSDRGLRCLGLLLGCCVLAILWRNARRMGAGSPVVALALLEFTGITICYGDSIRGYGLGILLGLASFGAIWQVARWPTRRRWGIALGVSLLSVHALFYNCVWLAATCCGGAAVCIRHGRRWAAAAIFGIGVLCGVSMLIYLPMIRARAAFAPLLMHVTTPAVIADRLDAALIATPTHATMPAERWIWGVALVAAIVAVVAQAIRREPPGERAGSVEPAGGADAAGDLAAFCIVTLLMGAAGYVGFLLVLKNYLQSWYFLDGLAMAAACVDGLLAAEVPRWARPALVLAALAAAAAAFFPAWRSAGAAMSSVDQAARTIRLHATSNDLLVLTPWWLDQSFIRCDHGPAPLMTLPPMADLRFARYDLMLRAMHDPAAAAGVIDQAEHTLRDGGRVWVVTVPTFSLVGADAARRAEPPTALHDWDWFLEWNAQLAACFRRHGSVIRPVPLPGDRPMNRMEEVQLFVAEGWRR